MKKSFPVTPSNRFRDQPGTLLFSAHRLTVILFFLVPAYSFGQVDPFTSAAAEYGFDKMSISGYKPEELVGNLSLHVSSANTGYFDFSKAAVSTSNNSQTFSAATRSGSFTFIDNPLNSTVRFDQLGRNNIVKRFYVWDANVNSGGAYVVLDDVDNDGAYTKSVGTSEQNENILAGQSFIIQTKADGEASLSFSESNKSALDYRNSLAAASGKTQQIKASLQIFNADGSLLAADGVVIEGNGLFLDAVNTDDAIKLTNTSENLGLYSHGTTLAIERRSSFTASDVIRLKLWKTTIRKYQLQFDLRGLMAEGLQAYIVDQYLQQTTPLNPDGKSQFNFDINTDRASANEDRFSIIFKADNALALSTNNPIVHSTVGTGSIVLDWTINRETNLTAYQVEKSIDGMQYFTICTLPANPQNIREGRYQWQDDAAIGGLNHYRVKAVKSNGQVLTSDVSSAIFKNPETSVTAFPANISNGRLELFFNQPSSGKWKLTLTNSQGESVFAKTIALEKEQTSAIVSIPAAIAKGSYNLVVTDGDLFTTSQFISLQ